MEVLIVGALELEIATIIERLGATPSAERAGLSCHEAPIPSGRVRVLRCGVGKVNAAMAVQRAIDLWKPDAVINTGVAGNLNPGLGLGDIVIGERCAYHDAHIKDEAISYPMREVFRADEGLITALATACEAALLGVEGKRRVRVARGFIATGDAFIESAEEKRRILDLYLADCVDMESAAIAHVCLLNATPFAAIRALSDDAGAEAYGSFREFLQESARRSASCVAECLKLL
jgi:adenosylhomocysteine nucleosidase